MDAGPGQTHFEQAYRRARLYRAQRERALACARAEKIRADKLAEELRAAKAWLFAERLRGAA